MPMKRGFSVQHADAKTHHAKNAARQKAKFADVDDVCTPVVQHMTTSLIKAADPEDSRRKAVLA
jgi:hypothetical protein